MPATVALIDDDRNILASLAIALEAAGFRVLAFGDGAQAVKALAERPADLIVLDIKMPGMDGHAVLRAIRAESRVPVIFLTSKDAEIDEVEGLKRGADDYIRKPFSTRLLIERIRALLRRSADAPEAAPRDKPAEAALRRGRLVLEPETYACRWDDKPVAVTVSEFLLLKALAERPGHVKTRDQLIDVAYGAGEPVDDRSIDSHVKRLRKKFRAVDPKFDSIATLYGVGYKFSE
ncbi:MAG: response regulator transcription factor [Alphaproteobacteria bacterium]|nr:response regulator transcription factor [Alphaproteobacteria bacterium]